MPRQNDESTGGCENADGPGLADSARERNWAQRVCACIEQVEALERSATGLQRRYLLDGMNILIKDGVCRLNDLENPYQCLCDRLQTALEGAVRRLLPHLWCNDGHAASELQKKTVAYLLEQCPIHWGSVAETLDAAWTPPGQAAPRNVYPAWHRSLHFDWHDIHNRLQQRRYPADELLLIGASHAVLWEGFMGINAGIAGNRLPHMQYQVENGLLDQWRARAGKVLVWLPISEFMNNRDNDHILQNFEGLVRAIAARVPAGTTLLVLGFIPHPHHKFSHTWERTRIVNRMIVARMAPLTPLAEVLRERDVSIDFHDLADVLLENGSYRPGVVGADRIHFNEAAYAMLAEKLSIQCHEAVCEPCDQYA